MSSPVSARRRVPASERREALIDAAVHEFALGGLHGTPVTRIAARVGVAQPYVFSLFQSKRELFMAALERSFERVADVFREAAAAHSAQLSDQGPDPDPGPGAGPEGRSKHSNAMLAALGDGYRQLLERDRDYLMLQHQAYASAAADEVVRELVRRRYAELVDLVRDLSGAPAEEIDEFFRYGMALNVAAALGVEDLSVACPWLRAELAQER